MYGKIFASMYEGSLYGHWQAIVTMQQLIVICDPDGVVDMTPAAISGRTSIPLEIIDKGIEELAKPDLHSRSDEAEGRRIVPIDPTRPWGWRIVNYAYYRDIVKAMDKREADRERIAGKRAVSPSVAQSREPSQSVAKSRTSEAEAEAEAKREREGAEAPTPTLNGSGGEHPASEVNASSSQQGAAPARARAKARVELPEDFALTDAMRAQAIERYPDCDPVRMFEQFVAHHRQHGKRMASWPAAWVTWLGNAEHFGYARRATAERSSAGPKLLT